MIHLKLSVKLSICTFIVTLLAGCAVFTHMKQYLLLMTDAQDSSKAQDKFYEREFLVEEKKG